MVAPARTPLHAGRLRTLNAPRPIEVRLDPVTGDPISIRQPAPPGRFSQTGPWRPVRIDERWRIDDEWWRSPIERRYYTLTLAHGARLTIFHDARADTWFTQGG